MRTAFEINIFQKRPKHLVEILAEVIENLLLAAEVYLSSNQHRIMSLYLSMQVIL